MSFSASPASSPAARTFLNQALGKPIQPTREEGHAKLHFVVLSNIRDTPLDEIRARPNSTPAEDVIGGLPQPGDGTTLKMDDDGTVRRVPGERANLIVRPPRHAA
jgi:hypothetical protein